MKIQSNGYADIKPLVVLYSNGKMKQCFFNYADQQAQCAQELQKLCGVGGKCAGTGAGPGQIPNWAGFERPDGIFLLSSSFL
jgi:hypothetical protein